MSWSDVCLVMTKCKNFGIVIDFIWLVVYVVKLYSKFYINHFCKLEWNRKATACSYVFEGFQPARNLVLGGLDVLNCP